MKPYSVDLRQKVIDAHNQQEGSQRQLAKRFRVSLSFIQDLLKRYRSDGTIEPKAHGGGRSASFSPEQQDVVAQLVAARNDATLEELSVLVAQHIGVQVSRSTMGRVVQQLNLTWKKNAARN